MYIGMHQGRGPFAGTAATATIVLFGRLTIQKLGEGHGKRQYSTTGLTEKQLRMTDPSLFGGTYKPVSHGGMANNIAEQHGAKIIASAHRHSFTDESPCMGRASVKKSWAYTARIQQKLQNRNRYSGELAFCRAFLTQNAGAADNRANNTANWKSEHIFVREQINVHCTGLSSLNALISMHRLLPFIFLST